MNSPYNSVLQTALRKKAEGRGLKNSEIGAIARSRVPNRPVANNYRPLGAIVNQIPDRIHSLQESGGGGPFVFDNELHYNDGTTQIDIDGGGTHIVQSGTDILLNSDGIFITDPDGNYYQIGDGVIAINNGAKTVTIAASDITHDMGIKTFTGCNSGSPGSYDTLASAFY